MAVALAVFAHPDDMEIVASGTLLRLRRAGYEIHCLALANGCCGSSVYGREETVSVRRAEALAACRLAGFTRHESLVNDAEVFYERGTPGEGRRPGSPGRAAPPADALAE
jgi:LmbE family N-acetylglucosaminyl deacetylase